MNVLFKLADETGEEEAATRRRTREGTFRHTLETLGRHQRAKNVDSYRSSLDLLAYLFKEGQEDGQGQLFEHLMQEHEREFGRPNLHEDDEAEMEGVYETLPIDTMLPEERARYRNPKRNLPEEDTSFAEASDNYDMSSLKQAAAAATACQDDDETAAMEDDSAPAQQVDRGVVMEQEDEILFEGREEVWEGDQSANPRGPQGYEDYDADL